MGRHAGAARGGVNIAVFNPASLSLNVRPRSRWAFVIRRDQSLAITELNDATMHFTTPNLQIGVVKMTGHQRGRHSPPWASRSIHWLIRS